MKYASLIAVSIAVLVVAGCATDPQTRSPEERLAAYNEYTEVDPVAEGSPEELLSVYRRLSEGGERVAVYWEIREVTSVVDDDQTGIPVSPGREAHIRSVLPTSQLDVFEVGDEEAADVVLRVEPSFTLTEEENLYLVDYRYEFTALAAETREVLGRDVFSFRFVRLQNAEEISKLVAYDWE